MTERSPQFIDHMPQPGAFEAKRGLNPTLEGVDAHLLRGFDPTDGAEALERTLVRNFGQELQWGSPENHNALVKNAYGIARELGDRGLSQWSPAAFQVVDQTRKLARFNSSFRAESTYAGNVFTASDSHGVNRYHMAVAVSEVYQNGNVHKSFESRLRQQGIEIKPEDKSTLAMLFIVGHEAGHVIQGGINQALPENYRTVPEDNSADETDATARQILAQDPSRGRTGNLETDARIYNEQFAESYGFLVVSRAAAALGYDEATIGAVIHALGHREHELESLVHLDKVTPEKSLKTVLEEQGSSAYYGEAGYADALTPRELIADLERLNETLLQRRFEQPSSAAYTERFAAFKRMASRLEASESTPEVAVKRARMARLFKGKLRNRS